MKLFSCAVAFLLSAFCVLAEEPTSFPVGAFTFHRPAEWPWVPVNSPMRKAQLKVPGTDPAQSAEITFFHVVNGMGGDAHANAQRWFQQFESKPAPRKSSRERSAGSR